jgi:glycosyltransferase involved in cell wall biosynthesis
MPAPIRTVRIVAGLDPTIGGPPISSANGAIAESRAGIECAFAYTGGETLGATQIAARLAEEGVTVYRFPLAWGDQEWSRQWGVSVGLARWIFAHVRDYHVVHVHGPWLVSSLAGILAAKLRGSRVVLTPHEALTKFDIRTSRTDHRRRVKKVLSLAIARMTDAVVFASELERRDSRVGRGTAGVVIPHPVVDERRNVEKREGMPCDVGSLTVGFLGRLHPKKNVEALVGAVSQAPNVRLLVAGDGEKDERNRLRSLSAALGVEGRIEWRGFVDEAGKGRLLDEIAILAMPSEYECFGVAAVEALQAGVPVIVSRSSGVADVVARSEVGFVVDPNVSSLAALLNEIGHRRQMLNRVAARAREVARQEFSFGRYGQAMTDLYSALLAR